MNRSHNQLLGFILFASIWLSAQSTLAERTKVIVILPIEATPNAVSVGMVTELTESVYAAATEVSPELFSVMSKETVSARLATAATAAITATPPPKTAAELGQLVGADLVFSGQLRNASGEKYSVTLHLYETGSGRILGLERAESQNVDGLWNELRKVARQMLLPLMTPNLRTEPGSTPIHATDPLRTPQRTPDFLVQFRATPTSASVYLDDKEICDETPCSYRVEPGDHKLRIWAPYYKTEQRRVIVDRDQEFAFTLEPKKYNFFGMQDAERSGFGVTVGMSPVDTDYKIISVLSGSKFAQLNPIIDIGSNGEVFGFRQMGIDRSWSILGFGPSFRLGRIIVSSQVQLLSFRVDRHLREGGWQPGVTSRVQIPLVNSREVGRWASLIPTPAAGFDIWFDKLDYDQHYFWLGLSWLGGVSF